MKTTRPNHTPAFKAKVALAAVQEQESIAQLAKRYGVHANQIYKWKREFIEQAAVVFERGAGSADTGSEREDELLKKIGELTVERDFLSRGLGQRR
jgi:transposase-like protein